MGLAFGEIISARQEGSLTAVMVLSALESGHETKAPISMNALPNGWSVLVSLSDAPPIQAHRWIMPPARAVVVNLGPLQTGGR